jgi:hypothetical protein
MFDPSLRPRVVEATTPELIEPRLPRLEVILLDGGHGSLFHLGSGGRARRPGRRVLRTFATRVVADRVEVEVT